MAALGQKRKAEEFVAAEEQEKYSLVVRKADFKFNAAHFCAYKGFREKLHGHNYKLGVRLESSSYGADGYILDFCPVKKAIRAICSTFNERFLCPVHSDVLKITKKNKNIELVTEDGSFFSFPEDDVLMLPLKHTTVEELSSYVWSLVTEKLDLAQRGIDTLQVTVEETPGQQCCYRRRVKTGAEGVVQNDE